VLILFINYYALKTLLDISANLVEMLLISLTLLLTPNRPKTYFLRDLRQRLKNHHGLLENSMQRLKALSLISLLPFILDTQKENPMRDLTLFWQFWTRSLVLLRKLELEMIRVKQQIISIRLSVHQ
jgi:hypothetical protein